MATTRRSWTNDGAERCEPVPTPQARGRTWSIVLAGGDGSRLMGASIHGRRVDRPKQFCRFGGDHSLLGTTLRRAARVSDPAHILPVVMAGHHRWWAGELKDVPRANLVVQPGNRGTATAILHALIRILRQDEHAIVVVHPCDHGIASEVTLIAALDQAIASASGSSDLVLLGVVPDDPETEYGWIVPDGRDPGLHRVQAFVEKPHSPHAHRLREQGGLWNTFLFAVRARALFDHYIRSAPQLVDAYLAWIAEHGWDDQAMTGFYASLAPFDFSRDVLQHASSTLRVLPVHGSGWTDLGTPARVEAWLDRAHRSPATSETRATPGAAGAAR